MTLTLGLEIWSKFQSPHRFFGLISITVLYFFCFSLLHEAHEFLLSDARRCLELLGGSVLPFEIQESIIQMSLRKDQKVNRSLTDEIRMLGTAVYLGNIAIPQAC